jgi:hypothetical protein
MTRLARVFRLIQHVIINICIASGINTFLRQQLLQSRLSAFGNHVLGLTPFSHQLYLHFPSMRDTIMNFLLYNIHTKKHCFLLPFLDHALEFVVIESNPHVTINT